jgi:hypothetical protein
MHDVHSTILGLEDGPRVHDAVGRSSARRRGERRWNFTASVLGNRMRYIVEHMSGGLARHQQDSGVVGRR